MPLSAKTAKADDQDELKADGLTDEPPQRLLSRLATWAGVALICSGAAIMVARTDAGSQRLSRLLEPAPPPVVQRAEAPRPAASDPLMLYETRRLADAVRSLSVEREALAERVAAMERMAGQGGGDITASIPPREPAVAAAPAREQVILAPAPVIAAPTPVPRPGVRQIGLPVEAPAPAPAAAPATAVAPAPATATAAQESTAIRTDFGVDLAGELSMDALRSRWQQLRAQHGPLLEGLRPLVAVQDGARAGTVDLRLVAGPLANANAATRLCASLATAGVNCKPTVFDGQRLALR
ncbi:MAG: hypothetical protein J0H01_31700 [Rhizobiales bacterium]|nr:hypothetical protein [Hyphomicrobiales bacterium]